MKTIPYNPNLINDQQHAVFERQGWAIFNGNQVEKIDDLLEWINDSRNLKLTKLPKGFTQLTSELEAVKLAKKQGFIVVEDEYGLFNITNIIIENPTNKFAKPKKKTYTKQDLDNALGQFADEMGLLTSKQDIKDVNKTIKKILKRF